MPSPPWQGVLSVHPLGRPARSGETVTYFQSTVNCVGQIQVSPGGMK